MTFRSRLALLLALAWPAAAQADAQVICTLIMEIGGPALLETGDCDGRVTPASTFKVPLALIGYATGRLVDDRTPVMIWRKGEPDWGGAAWTQADVTPAHWMRHSVLWYSQRLAHDLGAAALTAHAQAMDYGNADFSGDPGKGNGLDRAWVSSSLKISPREQARFIARLATGDLPYDTAALDRTRALLDPVTVDGWTVRGKTGSAFPRKADGAFDHARGWGWYVAWAERDGRRLALVRLTQAVARSKTPHGIATRDRFLADLPGLLAPR